MVEISDSVIPFIKDGIKVREETFGMLLVSKRTPILALNSDSALIWGMIDGKRNISEIANTINSDRGCEDSDNIEIVKCFVKSCYELGLLDIR